MRQPSGRLSDRTLPPLSTAEKAASARGETSPPTGRSSHGKPENPPRCLEDWSEILAQDRSGSVRKRSRPCHVRGDPPGAVNRYGHGPPGTLWLKSHDPPGDPPWRGHARGDPPLLERRPSGHTYGCNSGPLFLTGYSSHKDPPFFRQATGPPGAISAGMIDCWPPPRNGRPEQSRLVGPRSRGDPPGTTASRRCCDPPGSVAGPVPPGPVRPVPIGRAPPGRRFHRRRGPPGSFHSPSSLSAGRCRERIPDVRPETRRHDVARKPKPKSRKITPWL